MYVCAVLRAAVCGARTSACSASRCFHIPDDRPSRELKGKKKKNCVVAVVHIGSCCGCWGVCISVNGTTHVKLNQPPGEEEKKEKMNDEEKLFLRAFGRLLLSMMEHFSSFWYFFGGVWCMCIEKSRLHRQSKAVSVYGRQL